MGSEQAPGAGLATAAEIEAAAAGSLVEGTPADAFDSILGSLYRQVAAQPSALALCDDRHRLNFADLLWRAKQVHGILCTAGIGPGGRVAIWSDNTIEYIIAIYGILHAGCTFVPLPFRDPLARTQRLCTASAVDAVFTSSTKHLEGVSAVWSLAEIIAPDRLSCGKHHELAPHLPGSSQDQVAYIIFTSGSTGEPKGVCISQPSFFHAVSEATRIMQFGRTTKSLALLPLHFDGSFSSVFPPLMCGGSVFVNRGPICLPATFCNIFAHHGVTHTTVTPTYLDTLLDSEDWSAARCTSWRTLAVGGEAPSKSALQRLRRQLPDLRFFNRYGPTEATMAVATQPIDDDMLSSEEAIPIGLPHHGVEFAVLGSDGAPVERGEIGELYIGGRQLMLGYLNDRQATDAVMRRYGPERQALYKTGDLVRVNAAGHYVFVGRSDNVIKRHGTRISLPEIEAALGSLSGVAAVACISTSSAGATEIVAFVQRQRSDLDEREIRRHLLRHLPAYMSPDRINFVPELPTTSSGKTDYKRLSVLAAAQ